MFALIITFLCIALGHIVVLRRELKELRGEKFHFEWNGTLTKVLDLLKEGQEKMQLKPATKAHGECAEEEKVSDNESVKRTLSTLHYSNSMDGVSDPELWQF